MQTSQVFWNSICQHALIKSCFLLFFFFASSSQAVSPDGEAIVTGAGDETLRFWNVFSKTRCTKVGCTLHAQYNVSMWRTCQPQHCDHWQTKFSVACRALDVSADLILYLYHCEKSLTPFLLYRLHIMWLQIHSSILHTETETQPVLLDFNAHLMPHLDFIFFNSFIIWGFFNSFYVLKPSDSKPKPYCFTRFYKLNTHQSWNLAIILTFDLLFY